jgi:hypothetical protein
MYTEQGTCFSSPSDKEVGGLQSAIPASGASNQTRIARRRAEEERGDMPFVSERRRSRRTPERDQGERSEQLGTAPGDGDTNQRKCTAHNR